MLIEAEAGSGVTAVSGVTVVPLSKYKDYNIIGLGRFDYQSMWAEKSREKDIP